jgi:pimeloyl-ACP methyl ester carboxylesterase
VSEVELSAGTVEYDDTGGDGPVLVLLHGLTMDSSRWRKVLPELPDTCRCVLPTLPLGGHRRPMRPDADLSLLPMVHVVLAHAIREFVASTPIANRP